MCNVDAYINKIIDCVLDYFQLKMLDKQYKTCFMLLKLRLHEYTHMLS